MKVGIIGCGFIGTELARFIDENEGFELIGLNDLDKNNIDILIKMLKNNAPKIMGYEDIIKKSDLIIESASRNAVREILSSRNLDKKGKILLIMSASGLIENFNLLNLTKNCEILLPSGAICGLDAIKAVSGRIKSLTLTTTKFPKALEGSAYVVKKNINLKNLKNKKIIFEGNIKEAIGGFPQNINVAATLFIASKFKHIKVKIIADPNTKFNTHEIRADGNFGIIKAITMNLPGKNPRTSYLAVLSAMQMIKNLQKNVKVGN